MITHKFIAVLFVVLVEFHVAKLDTVEIKLGRRNVIIPLNGHVNVKHFKPEEFENLKMSIPNLVELVAKARGRPPPPAPSLPPPRHPLPPDPYQVAPQYEPPYPNPTYRRYPQHQIPDFSEDHLLRNQPPINSYFSEYPQQENHSKPILPRQHHPLPYYEYTQPINHPEEAVQGSIQYYPSLHTPNHGHPRPQVTRTGNNFRETVHTTEHHLQTKATNGLNTYKEDIPRRQSSTLHHTDRRIHKDSKSHPQTKASNNNQDYIASHRSRHELPPNISTWLHDHEILEQIQSVKPAFHELPPNISTWLHDHEILEQIQSVKPAFHELPPNISTWLHDHEILEQIQSVKPAFHELPPNISTWLHDHEILKQIQSVKPASHELPPNISTWLHDHEILKQIQSVKPASHELPPNISTWLHDHEILEQIQSVKPASHELPPNISTWLHDHEILEQIQSVKPASHELPPNISTWLHDHEILEQIQSVKPASHELPPNISTWLHDHEILKQIQSVKPASHELPPNISTWLHDHEILEQIQSVKPAPRSKTRSKNPSPSHGPRQTFVYTDTPTYLSRSTIREHKDAPKVTPRLTSRFKDNNFTSYPKHIVKNNVVTSIPTSTSKEHKITAHPAGTSRAYVKNNEIESHSTLTSKQDVVIPSTLSILSKKTTTVNSQKINTDITTNAPMLIGTKKTLIQDTRSHIETFSPEHNTLHVPKDAVEEFITTQPQISQSKTDVQIISLPKHDMTTNSQEIHSSMETDVPVLITLEGFPIGELKTDIPPIYSSEHETAMNTQEKYTSSEPGTTDALTENIKDEPSVEDSSTVILTSSFFEHNIAANAPQIYSPETLYAQDRQTDVPVTRERGRTSKIQEIVTASNVEQRQDRQTQDIRTESLIKYLTNATSDSLEVYTHVPTDAPALNITFTSYARDPATDISVTTSLESDTKLNAEETSIDVTTTTFPIHDTTTEAQDIVILSVTDASALNITTESHYRTTPFRIYAAKTTNGLAINTATELHPQDLVTEVITKDNRNVTLFEEASVLTNQPASLNISTKTLVENTRTKLDTGTIPQQIHYSTSMNTPEHIALEPYTKDRDNRETSSSAHNTSNIPHVATNEYVLNETRELHIQNSRTNARPTSSEDDPTTDVEHVFTTGSPQEITERVAIPLSIESTTVTSPAAPLTPPITTVLTPAPSPSPQNKTTEIDVDAAAKRRTCKHARKKACGGTGKGGKPAATRKSRRRRRRRTTRAPQISYPTPAPGNK